MDTERTAAEVFRLLSDDSRIDILRAVAVAQADDATSGVASLSFSEIYDRVDVDNTSKFSYHLGELTGTFLRKHDGGYGFTHAGEQLVRFVLSGNYRSPSDFGTVETTGRCLYCGATVLEAGLRDQYFFITCADCGRPAFSYQVRPAQVRSHGRAGLVDSVIWAQAGDFLKMRQGVCPDCSGAIETDVVGPGHDSMPAEAPVSFATESECSECLRWMSIPLTHAAAYHPESVAVLWEHGVDVLGSGMWELHEHVHDGRWTAERATDGPGEYRVELEHGATLLRLHLDGNAAVVRTERIARRDQHDRRN
jgi:hypothetical protein